MADEHLLRQATIAISQSVGAISRRMRQTRASGGLSWSESSALTNIIELGGASSADLARIEGVTPQSMGSTFAALERRGFIARTADPDDGRRVVLSATEAGVDFYAHRVNVRVEQMSRVLTAEFDDAEIEALMAAAPLLTRLANRIYIDAHQQAAAPGLAAAGATPRQEEPRA